MQRKDTGVGNDESNRITIFSDHDLGHSWRLGQPFRTLQWFRDQIISATQACRSCSIGERCPYQINHKALGVHRSKRPLPGKLESLVDSLNYTQQSSGSDGTCELQLCLTVEERIEVIRLEETAFELYASRELVSVDRVTAEDEQMGAQEPLESSSRTMSAAIRATRLTPAATQNFARLLSSSWRDLSCPVSSLFFPLKWRKRSSVLGDRGPSDCW